MTAGTRYGPASARDAVRAGADSLEHATGMDDATKSMSTAAGTHASRRRWRVSGGSGGAGQLLVEVKCVDSFSNEHLAQRINYLKRQASGSKLLINFRRPKVE